MKRTFGVIFNLIAFDVAWLACVGGAAWGMPWLGPVTVMIHLALHGLLVKPPVWEWKVIAAFGAWGLVVDSALTIAGLYDFGQTRWIAPLWLIFMWPNLATSFNWSLAWMRRRPAAQAIFGAVGGPLAYLAGTKLGALQFGVDPLFALICIGLVWGGTMVMIYRLMEYWRPEDRPTHPLVLASPA
jgi:hypothetical protein